MLFISLYGHYALSTRPRILSLLIVVRIVAAAFPVSTAVAELGMLHHYWLRLLFTMFTALNAARHILREPKIRVHPKVGVWHCVSRVQLLVVLDLRRQIEDTHTRLERDLPLQHWKMKRGTFRCHRIFIVVILSSRYIQSEPQRNIKRARTDGWMQIVRLPNLQWRHQKGPRGIAIAMNESFYPSINSSACHHLCEPSELETSLSRQNCQPSNN